MLRELKTFVTVARMGTFAAAGQQVGLTQSAVSAALARLRLVYGATLVSLLSASFAGLVL